MNTPNKMNRRKFIGQAGCAALGSTGLLSSILNLGMASRVHAYSTAKPTDYKAMVCIFLLGGNDSWNMLIPQETSEFAKYQLIRQNLALGLFDPSPPHDPITPTPLAIDNPLNSGMSGRTFAVHPALSNLASLYHNHKLSFVSNVGSLLAPLANVTAYNSSVGSRPLGLFSHSDQQQQWQTCTPDKAGAIGWAGLAQDIFTTKLGSSQSAYTFNISLGGSNTLQTGNSIVPYSMGFDPNGLDINGVGGIQGLQLNSTSGAPSAMGDVSAPVNSILGQLYRNLYDKTYIQATSDAQAAYNYYFTNLGGDNFYTGSGSPYEWTPDPNNPLDAQLKQVANMIVGLGSGTPKVNRQTFFVTMGGYDTHHNLLDSQPDLFAQLDSAIGKFWAALAAPGIGMDTKVTMFTASDFGRTLSTNGSGADHAWGGNHFVINGDTSSGIKGGQILGYNDSTFNQYPIFDNNLLTNLDVSGSAGIGRLLPGLAVEEYMFPILRWYGLTAADIYNYVFSNYTASGHFGSSIRSNARIPLFNNTSY